MNNTHIELSNQPLSLDAAYRFVQDPACGGLAFFVGTVRNHSQGQAVVRLDFEAYGPMAVKELQKIADTALERFGVQRIYVSHREGTVEIEEVAVIIGVASHHRKAAFAACQYVIDTLKETVPIWKKEFLPDGSYWVNAHP
jgi:molybdopterin synthase catalytic subunit